LELLLISSLLFMRGENCKRTRLSRATTLTIKLLSLMTIADTISLICLLQFSTLSNIFINSSQTLSSLICKINLFLMHSAGAFSVWCWGILSGVRYMAVFYPYKHLKFTNEPFYAITLVICSIFVFESYILINVQYLPELKICTEDNEYTPPIFHIFEMILSYFLPLSITFYLDFKVFLNLNTLSFQGNNRRIKSQWKVLRRGLIISILDLMMNLPSYIIRLYTNIVREDQLSHLYFNETFIIIELFSQLLYFSQFFLNAFYLYAVIYRIKTN
uniref:G_PROTEIN_RECEP_F1_2 domain-containing protein n=1 Tax=Parastrongyloides trichosuri TaxID=131310 RepID=A0A0N4Z447_PARTI